jgi:GT2 family glycosyltransferase
VTESRCAILILNWNGWRDTLECLESVLRSAPAGQLVIVCDNASQDGSVERIREWAAGHLPAPVEEPAMARYSTPPVPKPIAMVEYRREEAEAGGGPQCRDARLVLIHTGGNLGFAGGNNVGLRFALTLPEVDRIWLLNNDTVVETDALGHLLRAVDRDPRIGICGSRLMHYYEPDRVQALGGGSYRHRAALPRLIGGGLTSAQVPPKEEVIRQLAYVTGASMLVTRRFLERVGLMSEEYFLYFEELDWSLRGGDEFRPGYEPESVVYHKEGRSIGTGGGKKSELSDLHFMRNRLRVTRRFFPGSLPTVRLALLVAAARRALRGDLKRALLVLKVLRGS